MSEPNAPEPSALREELINLLVAKAGGKITRHKAEESVDAMLLKQMMFYSQMAEPELAAPVAEQMALVGRMHGLLSAVILQGSDYTQLMSPEKLRTWQRVTSEARTTMRAMMEMFA